MGWRSNLASNAIMLLLYMAVAVCGSFVFDFDLGFDVPWITSGLALAAVLFLGYRVWPVITLAAFLFSFPQILLEGHSPPSALVAALILSGGQAAEALLGVFLVRRATDKMRPLDNVKDLLLFVLLAAFVATAVGSVIVVGGLIVPGLVAGTDYGALLVYRWVGSAVSVMLITLTIMAWTSERELSRRPRSIVAAVLPVAVAAACLQIILWRSTPGGATPPEVGLLIPPFIASLIWAAIRPGPRGVTSALLLTWVIALADTHQGVGSLVMDSAGESFLMVQASWTALTIVIMIPAAAIAEGKNYAKKLHTTKGELEGRNRELAALNAELELAVGERQRAEEQERRQKIYYEALLDAESELGQGLTVVDLSTQKILFANDAFCRMSGYPEAELLALPSFFSLIPPEQIQSLQQDMKQRQAAPAAPHSFELQMLRQDGGIIDIEVGINALTADGSRQQINVIRDVSERKRAGQELSRAMAELERSNTELQQFAYVASHDLQEPLRTVSNFVGLLAQDYGDRLGDQARELINFAVDGTARMQRMIEDLLAYSRVNTQGLPFAPCEFTAVLREALADLHLSLAESEAEVTWDPLPEAPADSSQIKQVFLNLIGNAVKFRGTAPPRIHVTARRTDGFWEFSIKDNGIGIDPRHFDRIFVIFQRLKERKDYPGTGIGLSLCKRIIERHGGNIWVQSQYGEGSTFYFTIPVVAASGWWSSQRVEKEGGKGDVSYDG